MLREISGTGEKLPNVGARFPGAPEPGLIHQEWEQLQGEGGEGQAWGSAEPARRMQASGRTTVSLSGAGVEGWVRLWMTLKARPRRKDAAQCGREEVGLGRSVGGQGLCTMFLSLTQRARLSQHFLRFTSDQVEKTSRM